MISYGTIDFDVSWCFLFISARVLYFLFILIYFYIENKYTTQPQTKQKPIKTYNLQKPTKLHTKQGGSIYSTLTNFINLCFSWKNMVNADLTNFFMDYMAKESFFIDKQALQNTYVPETINNRDEQINQVAKVLAPTLKLEKPSNLFIYGKTGTGKTLTIKHTAKKLTELTTKNNIPLKIIYLNCKLKKIADTEYRLVAQLAREFGKAVPPTGLPTDEVYKTFYSAVEKTKQLIIIILDEIDQLVKKTGDGILYNLTRANEELKNSQITLIGISNDLMFIDNIDSRAKSSLSEEEIVFPPYNALQIQDILKQRAGIAFKKGALEPGVVEKCAAYAAREHGDARRALELLRVAGELAEREQAEKIKICHLDKAEEKTERDRIIDIITSQPKQFQVTLYSILAIHQKRKSTIFTGEVYELYRGVCDRIGLRQLTQRRVSDIIGELDMFGIINAKVISNGRYGRTREISLLMPSLLIPKTKKILEEGLELS